MQGAACVDIIALTQHYCVPLRRLLRHQPAPAAPVHDAGGHLPWAGQVRTLQPGKKMGGHAGTCVCVYAGQCRVKHHTPNLAHTFGSLMKIYGTFLMGHLSRFKEDVQVRSVACKLAIAATLDHAKLHIIRHQLVAGCACACATPAAPQSCRRWAQRSCRQAWRCTRRCLPPSARQPSTSIMSLRCGLQLTHPAGLTTNPLPRSDVQWPCLAACLHGASGL